MDKDFEAIRNTLNAFLASPDFMDARVKATHAGYGGSGYSVELFEDGTWRVLWDNGIGNLYNSPGVILSVPAFDDGALEGFEEAGDLPWDFDDSAEDMRDALAVKVEMAASMVRR